MRKLELPLALPMKNLPMRMRFKRALTNKELQTFCERQEVLHIEREPNGTLSVRPIWGTHAGFVSGEVRGQLFDWSERTGRGVALGTCGFFLPDGSMRGPLIAFVTADRWKKLGPNPGFIPFCPEFVVEVLSHNNTRKELQKRMRMFLANGTELAWLIDPERKAVEIYRVGREPELQESHPAVYGEGPVAGFVLELGRIWS